MLIETLCNIPAKPRKWVWTGVIPEGQLTLLIGEPGIGKSMIAMDVIARATRGQCGLSDLERGEPGEVILFSGEDDSASVVRLRLDSAGADLKFVNVVDSDTDSMGILDSERRPQELDWKIESLEDYLRGFQETGNPCRLVVIDSLNAFLEARDRGSVDRARDMLTQLADLAVRSGTAVLLIATPSTFEKGKRGRSSATTPELAEAARSVWTILRDPDEPRRRMLLAIKTNLCETPPGLAFTIGDRGICWEEESVAQTAEQFVAEATEHERLQHVAAQSELVRATEWVTRRLADGPVYSNELIADAGEQDFSEKTLRRALIRLDCRKGKEKKANGMWYWRLPSSMAGTEEIIGEENEGQKRKRGHAPRTEPVPVFTERCPTSPSSNPQKVYQLGNLANDVEVGQLFGESNSMAGIEPAIAGDSALCSST
jgi:putative DNA primase/helicase